MMWSQRKSLVVQILGTFLGAGFCLLFVSAVSPAFTTQYPWVSAFLIAWFFVLVILLLGVVVRLRRSTEQTLQRRKDRYEPGWRNVEKAQTEGANRRKAAYSREEMLRQRESAERLAKVQAAERVGVVVSFKPESRDSH